MSTIENTAMKLKELRLPSMAEEITLIYNGKEYAKLSALEIIDRMADAEMISRKNNAVFKRVKRAKLTNSSARIDSIDYKPERRINHALIELLSSNAYIDSGRNVLVLGATGTGKSYIANALAIHACQSHKVRYTRLSELASDLSLARIEGNIRKQLSLYENVDLLVIDDFLLTDTTPTEQKDLMEVFEYRGRGKSTILCSQLSPQEWHRKLGGGHLADAILDRITNNSYTLELYGESLRKR